MGIGRGLRMEIDFRRGQTRLYLGLYEVELNGHLRELCRPGYRSFDVGGQLGYALRGAVGNLERRHPGLLVEVHSEQLEEQCLEILSDHGYSPRVDSPRRWVRYHRTIEHDRCLVAVGDTAS